MNTNQETNKRDDQRKNTVNKRRQNILEAGLKIFAEKGYNGLTTAEISRAAGVAEGTIFRHFTSKKDLLIAVFEPKVLGGLIQLEQGISIIRPWYEMGVEREDFRALPFLPTMRSFMGRVMFYGLFGHVFLGLSPEKTIEEATDQILDLFLHGPAR